MMKQHGAIGAAVLFIAYMGNRHMKSDSRFHHEVSERLRVLEMDRVVKADINRVGDQITAVSTELATAQREILLAIRKQ